MWKFLSRATTRTVSSRPGSGMMGSPQTEHLGAYCLGGWKAQPQQAESVTARSPPIPCSPLHEDSCGTRQPSLLHISRWAQLIKAHNSHNQLPRRGRRCPVVLSSKPHLHTLLQRGPKPPLSKVHYRSSRKHSGGTPTPPGYSNALHLNPNKCAM